jgi:hypothetical protein
MFVKNELSTVLKNFLNRLPFSARRNFKCGYSILSAMALTIDMFCVHGVDVVDLIYVHGVGVCDVSEAVVAPGNCRVPIL